MINFGSAPSPPPIDDMIDVNLRLSLMFHRRHPTPAASQWNMHKQRKFRLKRNSRTSRVLIYLIFPESPGLYRWIAFIQSSRYRGIYDDINIELESHLGDSDEIPSEARPGTALRSDENFTNTKPNLWCKFFRAYNLFGKGHFMLHAGWATEGRKSDLRLNQFQEITDSGKDFL